MNTNNYKIKLPSEYIESLDTNDTLTIKIRKEDEALNIETARSAPKREEIPYKWFLIPAIICTIIFFIFISQNNMQQVPMNGHTSIASLLIILGLISGVISFSIFFIRSKKEHHNLSIQDIYWRNVPTIIFSFAVILLLILMVFFWIIGESFIGASFDRFTATAIFFFLISAINYFMIYAALSFTSSMIITLLIAVIIGGVFFSMMTNSENQWWQYNFSFLGTTKATSSWQFNITLILSSLLMIALIDYLFVTLKSRGYKQRSLSILRVLLTMLALSLGGVGFFPNNGGTLHELHDRAAGLLVTLIIILIIGIRWLLPKVTKEFLITSYGIALFLIITNVLFEQVGYLSLTAFELIAFGLSFCWILLLLQQINRLTVDSQNSKTINITDIKNGTIDL